MRLELPGYDYVDGLPDGRFAALKWDDHVRIYDTPELPELGPNGELPGYTMPLPGTNVLSLRVGLVEIAPGQPLVFGVCGKGWAGARGGMALQWTTAEGWTEHGLAHGVNACIFHRGKLVVFRDAGEGTSGQGWRYVDDDDQLVRGDDTLLDEALQIAEWTRLGGVTSGQGMSGGTILSIGDGKRRLLEPGFSTFVNMKKGTAKYVIAIRRKQPGLEQPAVIQWLDTAEMARLPIADVPGDPPLACGPLSQVVAPARIARFSASGGTGQYDWSAPNGDPASGRGQTFATAYERPGAHTVTVTSGPQSAAMRVTVQKKEDPPVDVEHYRQLALRVFNAFPGDRDRQRARAKQTDDLRRQLVADGIKAGLSEQAALDAAERDPRIIDGETSVNECKGLFVRRISRAFALEDAAWGLREKADGTHAVRPQDGLHHSTDAVLYHVEGKPNLDVYDLLSDYDAGCHHNDGDTQPAGRWAKTLPEPGIDDQDPPDPADPDVLKRLAALEARVLAIETRPPAGATDEWARSKLADHDKAFERHTAEIQDRAPFGAPVTVKAKLSIIGDMTARGAVDPRPGYRAPKAKPKKKTAPKRAAPKLAKRTRKR